MGFSRRSRTQRRATSLSCSVIVRKKAILQGSHSLLNMEYFMPPSMGIILKWLFTINSDEQQEMRRSRQSSRRYDFKASEQVKDGSVQTVNLMLPIINIHIYSKKRKDNRALVSIIVQQETFDHRN
ncbi:hypothetical protein F2P81_013398 [Scophthalmus maximus]|uniref:Uncharacterized protein n=1 Tax=Scophthalmus maximus TaxID=52904 RepID=A0A6A4STA5_SCOMX|nr:hypothetical protein F2P81_013398 [Scophthalmus maximus]